MPRRRGSAQGNGGDAAGGRVAGGRRAAKDTRVAEPRRRGRPRREVAVKAAIPMPDGVSPAWRAFYEALHAAWQRRG
ncbi:hypothetical protein [Alicyclobacillus macrosporangiidus]|uniref:Uncharacterized protein n=1 Tax=Alicyclobacillus macrosporangiidus TaxID=392015 RepID=A0A1I7GBD6_9BACL|nr:hypothetical protein [Alicyclobacillus macrosporangiidus]SFU45745.1 hypothetical protein SAMN05421543_102117 [Alicyclobacillus macrosporangiidus]